MKVKQSDIAKVLGVSEARVSQLKRIGMPTVSIDLAAAWYRENVDQKFSPKLEGSSAPPAASETMGDVDAVFATIHQSRAKREFHESNLAELKERKEKGELVEADRVRRVVTSWAAQARSAFEKVPDKLAERLSAETDPAQCHALLTSEIDMVLADLSAGAKSLQLVSIDGR